MGGGPGQGEGHGRRRGGGLCVRQEPRYAPIRYRYVPADSPEAEALPDWEGSKEQAWLEAYDPAERVVLVVLRYDSSISSYFIGAEPAPPEAHAVSKTKEN